MNQEIETSNKDPRELLAWTVEDSKFEEHGEDAYSGTSSLD